MWGRVVYSVTFLNLFSVSLQNGTVCYIHCYFLLSVGSWGWVSLRGSVYWGPGILGIQAKDKSVVINFLFGQAKLATWLTRCNWLVDPELMFQQLRAEYEY